MLCATILYKYHACIAPWFSQKVTYGVEGIFVKVSGLVLLFGTAYNLRGKVSARERLGRSKNMVIDILDGNSEYVAYVRRKTGII